jgi:CubicO group peptidase (beta-lactamase class C family)
MHNRLIALVALALAAEPIAAQTRDVTAMADTVFSRWNSTHTPGCAVGVARDGKTLLTRGYGMADLETGTANTAETIFESGSVAKQFTATAVMLLVLDGKLKLDDPARKYVPELPEYDRPITVRHLLTHTSGLRDWGSIVEAAGWPRGSRAHTQADLLDAVFHQKALNYPVGDYYSYTNTGYALAMAIVERLSGKPFAQFSQERIFQPLAMTHTQWRDDFTRLVPGRAQAYTLERDGWHLEMPFENVTGPGGLLTTVGDWLTWNEALSHNKLFFGHADSLTQQMRLTSGRQIPYALGLVVGKYRGVLEVQHSGSTAGYSTYLARYPDRGNLSIAVLCNSTSGAAGTYVHQLADRLIADFPRASALDTTRADPASLVRYFGIYRNDRTRSTNEVNADVAARLRAMPDGSYWMPNGARWRFEASPAGKPVAVRIVDADGDTLRYTFVSEKPWSPTVQELRAFEGSYRSDEVGVTYVVKVVGDSLTMSLRPGRVRTLRPTVADAFSSGGTSVWFSRDARRGITAMHFSDSRMWDLVLGRVSSAR